jgi:hypothetical protein
MVSKVCICHKYLGLPTYLVWPTYLDINLNLFSKNSIDMPHDEFLLHHVSQFKTIQA